MAVFGLVHGAWHGSWCWDRLSPELLAMGHEVVAVDLPCDDPQATFSTYADAVATALEDIPDVVLVGHSLAGLTIPLVALRREVRHLVYVCAVLPESGRSFAEQLEAYPDMLNPDRGQGTEVDDLGRRRWVDVGAAHRTMFGDCSEADTQWAFGKLRPQAAAPYLEPCPPLGEPTAERTYIVCSEDRLVHPAWSRQAARERLGVDAVELQGSHSPFLSRPRDLARLLVEQTKA